MEASEDVLKTMVIDELRRGSESGEGRSRSALREAVGVGAGDLDRILTELREAGEASEQAPDEWILAGGSGVEDDEPEPVEEPGVSLAEAEAAARSEAGHREEAAYAAATLPGRPRGQAAAAEVVRVQLDAAVAAVMESDALGKLVEAGIVKAAERQVGFVFEVTP
jgi:hypothetical protein